MEGYNHSHHHSEATDIHHQHDDDESPQANASMFHYSQDTHHHTHFHYSITFVNNVNHQGGSTATASALTHNPTVRVFTKADPNFCLTIRHGNLILAKSDPNNEYQNWYKVDDYNSLVKDKEGSPAFSLVNKVTGEAIKHSTGDRNPVQLVVYSRCSFDESILWTESREIFDGYRSIRMVNNIHLNVDAAVGGGEVHDGTVIIMWKWHDGNNQKWKILPC